MQERQGAAEAWWHRPVGPGQHALLNSSHFRVDPVLQSSLILEKSDRDVQEGHGAAASATGCLGPWGNAAGMHYQVYYTSGLTL